MRRAFSVRAAERIASSTALSSGRKSAAEPLAMRSSGVMKETATPSYRRARAEASGETGAAEKITAAVRPRRCAARCARSTVSALTGEADCTV